MIIHFDFKLLEAGHFDIYNEVLPKLRDMDMKPFRVNPPSFQNKVKGIFDPSVYNDTIVLKVNVSNYSSIRLTDVSMYYYYHLCFSLLTCHHHSSCYDTTIYFIPITLSSTVSQEFQA